jgi:hypothetical protein
MSAGLPSNEFSQFCDFLVHLRDEGAEYLTPEQSVEEFRKRQDKIRAWHEANAISQEQVRRGEAKPLDDEAVISRLRKRLADHGISD